MDLEEGCVEGSIVSFARLDAWVATVISCLCDKERVKGEKNADIYRTMQVSSMWQLIEVILQFFYFWERAEFKLTLCIGD